MSPVTNRSGRLALAGLAVAALAGCGVEAQEAAVVCEQLVDQRVGAELVHRSPETGAEPAGRGRYTLRSSFTERDGSRTGYTCTIERVEGRWRLVELVTDR